MLIFRRVVFRRLGLAMLMAFAGGTSALADDLAGAGSSFVNPILGRWSADYQAKAGQVVKYQSIGSGGGITLVKQGMVDFAASDAPLKPQDLEKSGLAQFPLVIGGIVPVVNVDGVKPGDLKFTGPLLADIFLGKVKAWNDRAIVDLNPDVKLPATPIIVAHRIDGSGTTFNFANYLSKVSPAWRDRVGEGMAVAWPTGAGAKGNEGVAAFVLQTRNAIGYVEYAYAVQNRLAHGLVRNRAGTFVKPGAASFQAAAAGADWAKARDFYLVMTDPSGADAYPIAATAFVLMPRTPRSPERARLALRFFQWALESGQTQAAALDYVPLPPGLVAQVEAYWKSTMAFMN